MLPTLYIDHLVFRVEDLEPTAKFYRALLGEPTAQGKDFLVYKIGDATLFFTPSARPSAPYNKELPGLNHLALGVHDPADLRKIEDHLNNSGLKHSGIGIDSHGGKEYIWFNDPNGFRLEFYCRPASE
ncbi:VOC family protein [Tunturiibacter gelidoferens]|uniref:VOC family protein n=1 Tax=Tunturiibacter gelidiferens TaxID=3069689 RepID=A0AAU7Z6J2_9BACT